MFAFDYNMKVRGVTQYTNFNFNSMVNFNGKVLFASNDGLYECGCSNDSGTDIDAYFEPIISDFGITNPKRIRFVYFGFEANGCLKLTLSADEQIERVFTFEPLKKDQQRFRLPIDRNGYGRYWMFRISNVKGSDFSIDSIRTLVNSRNEGHR